MNDEAAVDVDENPFSTRFVRPGAIDYLFPGNENLELLVMRWREAGLRGEIVGPHGSGKSTLLTALLARLTAEGWRTFRCDLHDGQRSLPSGWLQGRCGEPRAVIAIDGYEQLSRWQRSRVLAGCQRRGCGLVVTAHATVGLPTLWTTRVDPDRAEALFRRLMATAPTLVTVHDLHVSLLCHPTDLRSVWFELYDLYEQRRRARSAER